MSVITRPAAAFEGLLNSRKSLPLVVPPLAADEEEEEEDEEDEPIG